MAKRAKPPAPSLLPLPPEDVSPQPEETTEDVVEQMMYYVAAPYVTWPGYEDIYQANDNRQKAIVHRLAHHKEIFEAKHCTEFEAMLYISTATLAHPPSHKWFEIYMWLFRRWNPKLADECGFEEVRWTQNHQEDLTRLRIWIFRVQMTRLKAKLKQSKEAHDTKAREEREVQAFLFGQKGNT